MPDDNKSPPQVQPKPTPFTWHVSRVGTQPLPNGEVAPLLRLIFHTLTGAVVLFLVAPDAHALAENIRTTALGGLTVAHDLPPDPFGRQT